MTDVQKDLVFHLFIIEDGDLTDETLNIWKQDVKTKERLDGLTNDDIRTSARNTADMMNEKIGCEIY